jgi:nitroreductase
MPTLNLSPDELLTTTRAVRKRLDLTRPVEPEVIQEALEIAVQAPTPGSEQNWHFIVVTDPVQRKGLGDLYYRSAHAPGGQEYHLQRRIAGAANEAEAAKLAKLAESARYLTNHIGEVPVLVVPAIKRRGENLSTLEQAAHWGEIWPATWSFMLAARARGLGTVLTSLHLAFEQEAAALLGIPYEEIMQVGLIPVAYTIGNDFKPGKRKPLDQVVHWNRW